MRAPALEVIVDGERGQEMSEERGAAHVASGPEAALPVFGLSEQRLREGLEQELIRSMRAEGGAPTIHAIAASIARVLVEDHLRMAEQLEGSGVRLAPRRPAGRRAPEP
jgi:hypothetical protein